MRRKKTDEPVAATEPATEQQPQSSDATPTEPAAPAPATKTNAAFTERDVPGNANVQRISIKIKDDGTIDFDSMRDATASAFKTALAKSATDPKNLAKLGLAPQQQPTLFPPQFCEQIFDGIGRVTGIVYVKATKIPPVPINANGTTILLPVAVAKVFEYTDEEKKALAKPLSVVLSKHAPATLAKYSDEIQLAWTFASINMAKIEECNRMVASVVAALKAREQNAQPATGDNAPRAMAATA